MKPTFSKLAAGTENETSLAQTVGSEKVDTRFFRIEAPPNKGAPVLILSLPFQLEAPALLLRIKIELQVASQTVMIAIKCQQSEWKNKNFPGQL